MCPKQLSIIKLGIKFWNDWRKKNPAESIDLSGLDLNDRSAIGPILWDASRNIADLSGVNFSNADLSDADLEGADFSCADLSGSNLANAMFWDSILVGADLSYADITCAFMVDADLTNANACGIKYKRKEMIGKYRGIKVAQCQGSADFRAAAMDQAYIDGMRIKIPQPIFWAWGFFTDFGRSIGRTGLLALGWILFFSVIYYLDFYFFHSIHNCF